MGVIAFLVLFSEKVRRETSVRGGRKVVGKSEHAGNVKEEVISLSRSLSLYRSLSRSLALLKQNQKRPR